jgi:hypothetical protein
MFGAWSWVRVNLREDRKTEFVGPADGVRVGTGTGAEGTSGGFCIRCDASRNHKRVPIFASGPVDNGFVAAIQASGFAKNSPGFVEDRLMDKDMPARFLTHPMRP